MLSKAESKQKQNTKNAGKSAVPRERQTEKNTAIPTTKAKLLNAYKYL